MSSSKILDQINIRKDQFLIQATCGYEVHVYSSVGIRVGKSCFIGILTAYVTVGNP